jgi:hypothetical protein
MSPRLMETGNGLIEVGLCFSHVASQLRIHIISAQKLRAVNLHGGHSGKKASKLVKSDSEIIFLRGSRHKSNLDP